MVLHSPIFEYLVSLNRPGVELCQDIPIKAWFCHIMRGIYRY